MHQEGYDLPKDEVYNKTLLKGLNHVKRTHDHCASDAGTCHI